MSDLKESLEEGFKNDLLFGTSAYKFDENGLHVLSIEEIFELENMNDQTKPLSRMALLQDMAQRYEEYNNRLDKLIADAQELKRLLNPSVLDTNNPIHQLHQQIISQYPIEQGQNYQAIDSGGSVFRYTSTPFIGTHNKMWYSEDDLWFIGGCILNGINWRDTLIKL